MLTGALAFFIGRSESGELGFHAMLLLGAYPVDLFAGAIRVLLFTVDPGGVHLGGARRARRATSTLGRAVALAGVAAVFAIAAGATFTAGLRRYTSGSVWTRA